MTENSSRILVIDDNQDILIAAKFLLKKQFGPITTLSRPDQITHLLNAGQFDVVLLDMNFTTGVMTGQEGFEALSLIRQLSPHTRVIMMTAYGDIDLAIKAIKEGAFDFIVKPWDNAKLQSVVMAAYQSVNGKHPTGVASGQDEEITEHIRKGSKEVDRIFMFLDIAGSTTIAEKLGHEQYFELLSDFFGDIAEPISRHQGQIYQYVGDEVVITWPMGDHSENARAIHCFYDIEKAIDKLREKYERKYGLKPNFKAGVHHGTVSTGVVGTLKKEIIYTGDVLNTASRIEGQCNIHKEKLLLSEDLLSKLQIEPPLFAKKIGNIRLRGKEQDIVLHRVAMEG